LIRRFSEMFCSQQIPQFHWSYRETTWNMHSIDWRFTEAKAMNRASWWNDSVFTDLGNVMQYQCWSRDALKRQRGEGRVGWGFTIPPAENIEFIQHIYALHPSYVHGTITLCSGRHVLQKVKQWPVLRIVIVLHQQIYCLTVKKYTEIHRTQRVCIYIFESKQKHNLQLQKILWTTQKQTSLYNPRLYTKAAPCTGAALFVMQKVKQSHRFR
jgi:hypothetical protein